jgi:chemotaxis protein methyltransferase CheR
VSNSDALSSAKNQTFTQSECLKLREILFQFTGNQISSDKRSMLESRLSRRLAVLNLTAKNYIDLIYKTQSEREVFISLLTTHKTSWFRENEHFQFLRQAIQEGLIQSIGSPLTLWSAASSTGEEAYSLAILLSELGTPFRILGTDISEECLTTCESGIYSRVSIDEQIEYSLKKRYFFQGTGCNKGLYRFDPHIASKIKWRKHNLNQALGLESEVQFDVIFLRNVLIYFDLDTSRIVITQLLKNLKPQGYLFLGLCETILEPETMGLKRVANSVFLK